MGGGYYMQRHRGACLLVFYNSISSRRKNSKKDFEYMILYLLEKWVDVSVLDFLLRRADTNSRGFEPATLVAGPAALTY